MSTFEPPGYPDSRPVFPQELFDKLVDLVEVDSSRHPVLLNFSLVSKAWAHRSCKRMFSQVTLTTKTAFERWCKNTAPGPGGPSSLVQVLIFSQLKKICGSTLASCWEDHLLSFTDLKGFVAINIHTICFKDRTLLSRCFHVIGQGLRFVRLHHVRGTPQTLAVEYYSKMEETFSEEPVEEMNGQFQGCLWLL